MGSGNSRADDITMDHYASNSCSDYSVIGMDQFSMYESYTKAAHAMIYGIDDTGRWNILMHMRFDGFLGFPGGLTDAGETIEESITRELHEEIGWPCDEMIKPRDRKLTHINDKTKLILHFFCCQVSHTKFKELIKKIIHAKDYGIEVQGPIKVTSRTDLNKFLHNVFIGNTKDQLIYAVENLLNRNQNL